MSNRFEGKVALVTGGSSGIGRAAALAFARSGAKVVISNRSAAEGEDAVREVRAVGGEATFVAADVSKSAEVQALIARTVERYGRLDFAFNNAGTRPSPGPTAEQTEEDWDRMMDVNLKGTWLCMKHEIPEMLKQGGGAIVNNASVSGLVGLPMWPAQVASKHGVVGLTKAAALELAQSGIRVNVVCPGAVRTPMLESLTGGSAEAEAMVASMEPMGRLGTPQEIAGAVIWLCSAEASFVTGHSLVVDGGWIAQ